MKIEFMQRAIQLSLENMRKGSGGPFGAVIVKNGKILGEGWNQVTSTNDPSAHAEVVAIREACRNLNHFDLEGESEIYCSCEPCPMCLSAIYWARIDKIYFANTRQDAANIGFDDEFLYQEIVRPLPDRKVPIRQYCREEAQAVFTEWMQKTDKVLY